jgi:uncharacterized membrane protein
MSDQDKDTSAHPSGKDPKNLFEAALEEQVDGHTMGLAARLRGYLLAGILVTAPIGITVYLTYIFLRFVDTRMAQIIPDAYFPETYLPGIGLLIAIVAFILIGWLAKNVLGRVLLRTSEYFVHRVPVIRQIYSAIKQVTETIMASRSRAFRDVVLFEYPRRESWSIGFVTNKTEGEIQRLSGEDMVNIFVPTTPNPTSGYLLFVPAKDIYHLDMSVEEAIKLVVSAGIIVPPDRGEGAGESAQLVKPDNDH